MHEMWKILWVVFLSKLLSGIWGSGINKMNSARTQEGARKHHCMPPTLYFSELDVQSFLTNIIESHLAKR